MRGDAGNRLGRGSQVAGVVVGKGDAATGALGLERGAGGVGGGILERRDTCDREDAVETKGVVDDAGDITKRVAKAGVIRVLRTI